MARMIKTELQSRFWAELSDGGLTVKCEKSDRNLVRLCAQRSQITISLGCVLRFPSDSHSSPFPSVSLNEPLQVRATQLQDLVYKSGQAGIKEAIVSITFDNRDRAGSPQGFQNCDEIVVSRKVGLSCCQLLGS